MLIRYASKETLEKNLPSSDTFLLNLADDPGLLLPLHYPGEQLVFSDASLDYGTVRKPTLEDAQKILSAYLVAKGMGCRMFIAQCEAGVGRSQGVVAALLELEGETEGVKEIKRMGTYNRLLYRLILEAAGRTVPADPLVSMVIRLKYPESRFEAFIHSMKRQRWDRIEVVAVTDGPLDEGKDAEDIREAFESAQVWVTVIETAEAKGRWGHPYRQLGIDAAQGEWIGLSNDDNYYVPGFIEQMVNAGEEHGADLVLCETLHSYSGWGGRRNRLRSRVLPGSSEIDPKRTVGGRRP